MRRFVLLMVTIGSLVGFAVAPVQAAPAPAPAGYLIGTRAPLTAAQSRQLRDAGAQLRHVYTNFGGASAVMTGDRVARVRALPFVTSVNPDTLKQVTATTAAGPAQALPGTPYWLDQMDREKATETGAGVWVAVLDTGFYPNWRDYLDPGSILADKGRAFVGVLGNQNANQWDGGSDPHGMAVSATIVGHRFVDDTNEGGWGEGFATGAAGVYTVPGVASGAKVIPVKVCEPIGCFGSAINAGVDYVTTVKKAHPTQPVVLNASLGGPELDPVEKAAIDAAVAAGVVFVASAGNDGDHGMGFPAAYEPVISVGAGGWTEQWSDHPDKTWWLDQVPETGVSEVYIAGFSSRQKAGQNLDVVSEGRYMLLPYPCAQLYKDGAVTRATAERTCAAKASPDNASAAPFQYLFMSGTSFSSPATAGVVALMLQRNPSLSNAGAAAGAAGPLELALEGSAAPIAPGSATLRHRTGAVITETWGADATGAGWILVDQAVAAA